MLLYTVIPEEVIFAPAGTGEQSPPGAEIEINIGNISLLGQPLADGRVRITRIISSNSQDYLNPKWQPGMILENRYLNF